MPNVSDIVQALEDFAPPRYQEHYDNAGLIVGDPQQAVTGVLTCLDATEAVLAEAIERGCNLIVAHHPIVFSGLKRLTGNTYVERVVISAIRQGLAIYAAHTNLDNVRQGVNARFAQALGLENTRILAPKAGVMKKIVAAVPIHTRGRLAGALRSLQAHHFTFLPSENGHGEELQAEIVIHAHKEGAVRQLLRDAPFEACRIHHAIALLDESARIGAGLLGELPQALDEHAFLALLQTRMESPCIRHTALLGRPIRRVALCGGAGSFLMPAVLASGADAFVSADFKYHEFFDADGRTLVCDIGHYESERHSIALLRDIIAEKFPNFAVSETTVCSNPVQYFT